MTGWARTAPLIGGTTCMLATEATELRQEATQRKGADSAMPDQRTDRNGTGADDVLRALDELEAVLRENAESERLLAKRIADVRLARQNGRERKAIPGDDAGPGAGPRVSTAL